MRGVGKVSLLREFSSQADLNAEAEVTKGGDTEPESGSSFTQPLLNSWGGNTLPAENRRNWPGILLGLSAMRLGKSSSGQWLTVSLRAQSHLEGSLGT